MQRSHHRAGRRPNRTDGCPLLGYGGAPGRLEPAGTCASRHKQLAFSDAAGTEHQAGMGNSQSYVAARTGDFTGDVVLAPGTWCL